MLKQCQISINPTGRKWGKRRARTTRTNGIHPDSSVYYLCSSCTVSLISLSRFQGYPGEKGSSDIIDFNGELLDALRVSEIKASATEGRFMAWFVSCTPSAVRDGVRSFRRGGKQVQELQRKKLGYFFFASLIHISSRQAINTVTISVICDLHGLSEVV